MLASMPIDFPNLIPDDWSRWWDIWNRYASPLVKTGKSPNQMVGEHVGFDVIRRNSQPMFYQANYVDLKTLYPSLYDQIINLPIRVICARFVQSRGDFPAHVDNFRDNWALRCMFHNEDPLPQWYYTDLENNNKKYLYHPKETNWWAYLDGRIKHGTDFNPVYPKIILQIFSYNEDMLPVIEINSSRYPEYNIYYD